MKAAFVCWRPYQVFNAINMVHNNIEGTQGCSDLYIQDLPSLVSIVPHLAELKLFDNIYVFSELNRGDAMEIGVARQLQIYAVRTWNFVFAHSALKKNCQTAPVGGFKQYDLLLASGWISYFIEMVNCNPKARVVLFEDGTGSYISDQIATLPAVRRKYYDILKKLFHKGPLCVDVSALYVYNPALMMGSRPYPVYKLGEIDDALFDLLCRTFHYDTADQTYQGKRFVFLGQPLSQNNRSDFDELDIVKTVAKSHDLVYRKHPLQNNQEILEFEDQNRLMWELVCRNMDNNCVLIAQFSTAQLSPMILYGYCPKLVFLYKFSFTKESGTIEGVEDMINATLKNYGNDVYQPENLEEFYQIMEQLAHDADMSGNK